MYDIKPLEDKWKRYKKKKRKPWIIFFVFIILVFTSVFAFLNYGNFNFFNFSKFYNENNEKAVIDTSSTLLIDNALTTLEIKKTNIESNVKKPTAALSYKNGSFEITEDLPIPEDVTVNDKPRKKIHLNIVETTSVSAYKDVAKRFKQTQDTDDSLFLAKSYYSNGNYKKAQYWALQTNKVDANIEESLLIFIKTKVKMGHKNEAIRILTAYIRKSNSVEAKSLLYKIKKGTL